MCGDGDLRERELVLTGREDECGSRREGDSPLICTLSRTASARSASDMREERRGEGEVR